LEINGRADQVLCSVGEMTTKTRAHGVAILPEVMRGAESFSAGQMAYCPHQPMSEVAFTGRLTSWLTRHSSLCDDLPMTGVLNTVASGPPRRAMARVAVVTALCLAAGVGSVACGTARAPAADGAGSPTASYPSSSSAPDWTKQAPATSPSARSGAATAYDAATRTVVIFGGVGRIQNQPLDNTWTWNGTTWTKQAPATSPPARQDASMAYDAATRSVVLFGGTTDDFHSFADTWTWNGTTWTKQAPATSPPARFGASMAYDAATRTVVLFAGVKTFSSDKQDRDTWTWNGTTWTKQAPATSPPARSFASMAYDTAKRNVVLFGGINGRSGTPTWTWNGSTWARHTPAKSPPVRFDASMAYDTATGDAVLFDGLVNAHGKTLNDTWTWNGTSWTKQAPAKSPPGRFDASMAYDTATGKVMLFGGAHGQLFTPLGDTWTWD
jgi:hypothetical protein